MTGVSRGTVIILAGHAHFIEQVMRGKIKGWVGQERNNLLLHPTENLTIPPGVSNTLGHEGAGQWRHFDQSASYCWALA